VELKDLFIAKTDETPEVRLVTNSGLSVIVGRSLPENAFDFYHPILEWMKTYAASSSVPLNLELKFDYFNSSSGRYLFEILHVLEGSKYKENYKIIWRADKDDDLMIEKGEEFQKLSDLEFELVAE